MEGKGGVPTAAGEQGATTSPYQLSEVIDRSAIRAHLQSAKDQQAMSAKSRFQLEQLFSGPYATMTMDEIEAAGQQQQLTEAMARDIDENIGEDEANWGPAFDRISQVLGNTPQMPAPAKAQPLNPADHIAAGIGSLLFPEFA